VLEEYRRGHVRPQEPGETCSHSADVLQEAFLDAPQ